MCRLFLPCWTKNIDTCPSDLLLGLQSDISTFLLHLKHSHNSQLTGGDEDAVNGTSVPSLNSLQFPDFRSIMQEDLVPNKNIHKFAQSAVKGMGVDQSTLSF